MSTYFRFCNVFCQNVALFVICIFYAVRFDDKNKNKIESVISPYIYKLHAINPELSDMRFEDQGVEVPSKWQSYKFQALAESGCLDQHYYNKTTIKSTFKDITMDTTIWTGSGNTTGLSNLMQNPTNWDKQNEHIVCKCIKDIDLTDADASNFYETHEKFKNKIKDTCYDDNKIPIFSVESFENVNVENVDRHFSRFMLGILLLVFYAWSLSAKSWTDAVFFQEQDIMRGLVRGLEYFGRFYIFVVNPLTIIVCFIIFVSRCFSDIPNRELANSDAFDKLIMSLVIIAFVFIVLSIIGLYMIMFSNSENPLRLVPRQADVGTLPTIPKGLVSFRSSAELRTIMDYSFVLGGTIALIYASIMSGISSLASICTLFILAISIFYSIHVNFYMRNQLDVIMSNLDEKTRGHVFNTGGKKLEIGEVETIEVGLRPFANSIVMTRLAYLMYTLTLLISIVFMARDTPVASESYILSYQVNWIVLVFLTLCTFSYDFFNEVQQKIIKYMDHDLIVYAIIFISSHVFYIVK